MKKAPDMHFLKELLHAFGDPQRELKVIHIAGTNGKGSCATYLANALTECGYRCGRYISPFVVDFYERISIDGNFISDESLKGIIDRIKTYILPGITEFEVITAAAFLYFKEEGCDIAVMEAGIGGKNDATNIIEKPLCSVLMKIGLDHIAILGNTVEEIALDKCGIIKNGAPAVSYPKQEEKALAVIKEQAKNKNSMLTLPDLESLEIINTDIFGNRFIYKGNEYSLKLGGEHQIYNAITAIEALNQLKDFDLPLNKIKAALKSTVFPARLEVFKGSPDIIIDGAHNPDGMATLTGALKRYADRKIAVIFGVFADKDYTEEAKMLAEAGNMFFTVTPPGGRALHSDLLKEMLIKNGADAKSFDTDLKGALEGAREYAGKDGLVVICGSLYLASDIRKIINP